jgi:hypothetical protein
MPRLTGLVTARRWIDEDGIVGVNLARKAAR